LDQRSHTKLQIADAYVTRCRRPCRGIAWCCNDKLERQGGSRSALEHAGSAQNYLKWAKTSIGHDQNNVKNMIAETSTSSAGDNVCKVPAEVMFSGRCEVVEGSGGM